VIAQYHVPPRCQGQTVEVAYAQVGDTLLRRVTDRSDRSVDYAMAALKAAEVDGVEPWNDEPRIAPSRWQVITAAKADSILEE
jgi:hypothetical protein